jgi:hypothetical protein
MQQMWLYGNQLSGEIPASLGNLSFMRIFEVEDNNLSDSMPQSICDNLSTGMLEVLGGDCDKLDVSIPDVVGSTTMVILSSQRLSILYIFHSHWPFLVISIVILPF